MAFRLPTFAEIKTRVQGDLGSYSDGTTPRYSIEYVLADVISRVAKGLYGFLTYIMRQAWPDTADETHFWRHAAIWGMSQKPAVQWAGIVTFTGDEGVSIPSGTTLRRADGLTYATVSAVTISGGAATVLAQCSTAGLAGNNSGGQSLQVSPPVSGLRPSAAVTSTVTSGVDVESHEDGLARFYQRARSTSSGGNAADYIRWSTEVPGFTRAWIFPNLFQPNSVAIAAVRDRDGAGSAIVPDTAERTALAAYLGARRPATARVDIITLSAVPVNLVFTSLTPNTPEVKAAIIESVTDLLEREGAPGGTLLLSHLNEAISNATGEENHVLLSPAGDLTFAVNQMPVMGAVT